MFGGNQEELLKKMQESVAQSKAKLATQIVAGESGGGLIRIEMNGNRELQNLEIRANLADLDKEDLEDLLAVALKKALEEAEKVNNASMASNAQSMLFGM